MASATSSHYFPNSYAYAVVLLAVQAAFAVPIGKISNAIFSTADVGATLFNVTCDECTCAALRAGAIGWNCMVNNRTCNYISNYSSSDAHLAHMTDGYFLFREFPFELPATAQTQVPTITSE